MKLTKNKIATAVFIAIAILVVIMSMSDAVYASAIPSGTYIPYNPKDVTCKIGKKSNGKAPFTVKWACKEKQTKTMLVAYEVKYEIIPKTYKTYKTKTGNPKQCTLNISLFKEPKIDKSKKGIRFRVRAKVYTKKNGKLKLLANSNWSNWSKEYKMPWA